MPPAAPARTDAVACRGVQQEQGLAEHTAGLDCSKASSGSTSSSGEGSDSDGADTSESGSDSGCNGAAVPAIDDDAGTSESESPSGGEAVSSADDGAGTSENESDSGCNGAAAPVVDAVAALMPVGFAGGCVAFCALHAQAVVLLRDLQFYWPSEVRKHAHTGERDGMQQRLRSGRVPYGLGECFPTTLHAAAALAQFVEAAVCLGDAELLSRLVSEVAVPLQHDVLCVLDVGVKCEVETVGGGGCIGKELLMVQCSSLERAIAECWPALGEGARQAVRLLLRECPGARPA